MKKKITQRDKYQYSSLEKSQNLKTRQDDIDDVKEYFNQLNDEEKTWMNKFMAEYNNAEGVADNDIDALHNTVELRKAARDRNNARNRCIYTQEKAQNRLKYIEKNTELEKLPVDEFSKPVRKSRKKKKTNLQ